MDKNDVLNGSSSSDQLIKYAKDLSEVYKSEKEKIKELEAAHKQLMEYAGALNNTIAELKDRNKELKNAYLDTVLRLGIAAEYKDKETGDHIARMSNFSVFIAEKIGLPDKNVQNILFASPMHDVGKIGIPDSILLKKGKLTNKEFEIIKTHCTLGARLLSNSNSEILQLAESIALTHHEKWNGKGYPQGLSGEEIPIEGRIIALADVFDALTSKRHYKEPYPVEMACDIIREERGKHFDPELVDVFFDNLNEIIKMRTTLITL